MANRSMRAALDGEELMAEADTGETTPSAQQSQDQCEEHLLRAMVEEGLTLRQLVGVFRRFLSYCRCGRHGTSVDAIP